jgi:N-acetyl-anhydromuramyl-L-alanine amidase AmpD
MHIDSKTYEVKEINHYKNQTVKTQIVLATSLRKDSYHITRLLHKEFGNTKKWNTYTITRDGIVFQHYDNKFHSDFLGIKEGDKQSISIVLENMGCLFKSPAGKYINWLNEVCPEENVTIKNWFGYSYWENFTDEQILSTVQLCKELCKEHSIPKLCIDFHQYHKDIARFRGIVFRSNYIHDCSDINPLFDIQKFNQTLND